MGLAIGGLSEAGHGDDRFFKKQPKQTRVTPQAALATFLGGCEKHSMLPCIPLNVKLRGVWLPAALPLIQRMRRRRALKGRWQTWAEVCAVLSVGDASVLFDKVLRATEAVVERRERWDRDGAVLDTDEVHEPVLAVLREIAEAHAGLLDLVGFDGAGGGRQHRRALARIVVTECRGTSFEAYGSGLPQMVRDEAGRNIWAVRWLLQQGGLCVWPPWSMVEHIGFDASATNPPAWCRLLRNLRNWLRRSR